MSETLKMTGVAKMVGEIEEVGKNNFKKRLMVITVVDGEYSNEYGFEVLGDKVDMFDGISEGETVEVCYNLPRVREWNGKWFPDHLSAWKIQATQGSSNTPNGPSADNAGASGADGDELAGLGGEEEEPLIPF